MSKSNRSGSTLPDFLQSADLNEEVYVILPTPEEESTPPQDSHEPDPTGKPLTSWPATRDEDAHSTFTKKTAAKKGVLHKLRPRTALLTIFGIMGAATWYWSFRAEADSQFQVAMVTRGDLTKVVTATGQLNPRVTVQVSSQISGIVQKVLVDFNSVVKKQDVLAELDPATYIARVKKAEGEVAKAKAVMALAKVESERVAELRNQGLASQSDLDKGLGKLHRAEASLKVEEATLQRANTDLARCTIYAPMDGVVISRAVDVGQTVAASLSAPTLFVIANDLTKMQIDSYVSEADIGEIREGQKAIFTVDAFPERKLHGAVTQVRNAPIILQNVVTYDCVIEVGNSDLKLKPGMTANISIVVAQRTGVLKIPNACLRVNMPEAFQVRKESVSDADEAEKDAQAQALARKGALREKGRARRTVYVVPKGNPDGKPCPLEIQIGLTDGVETEVAKGVSEGDQLVTGLKGVQDRASQTKTLFGRGVRKL